MIPSCSAVISEHRLHRHRITYKTRRRLIPEEQRERRGRERERERFALNYFHERGKRNRRRVNKIIVGDKKPECSTSLNSILPRHFFLIWLSQPTSGYRYTYTTQWKSRGEKILPPSSRLHKVQSLATIDPDSATLRLSSSLLLAPLLFLRVSDRSLSFPIKAHPLPLLPAHSSLETSVNVAFAFGYGLRVSLTDEMEIGKVGKQAWR